MKKTRVILAMLFSIFFIVPFAHAKYPDRPIKILIPYSAGGTTDVGARMLASIAEKKLGQPVVVENKPGGSGTVALAACANAKPDGYTIVAITSSPYFVTPLLRKVTYNPISDLVPIMNYSGPYHAITVPASSDWKTLQDLVQFGKDKPNQATFGTAGTFSGAHISMLFVEKQTGAKFIHIPFKGANAALAALLGGHVSFAIIPNYAEQVRAGNFRLLAVLDGTRNPDFPDVPTLRELGYDWEFTSIVGFAAPKGTPNSIVKKLEETFMSAASSEEFKKFMKKVNLPVRLMNKDEFTNVLKKNYYGYQKAIKELKLTE